MITLHVNCDKASPAQLERAFQYLVRTNQRTVQVAAGAELQKGMDFVNRVRAALPQIKIFWRNMDPEDTGIHAVKTAQWIFDNKVKPYLEWFKRNNIVFVWDNESSGDDNQMRNYAKCTVEFLVLMHAVNLATGACRFATGNIGDGSHGSNQYLLLKPIFSAMLPSDWITPNEYSNAPGKSSGGHLERYKLMWKAAGKPLPTFIGEAGLCPDYDPGKGFRSIGMSGKAHADQMIAEEVWYEGVDRALFVAGGGFGWQDFQLIKEIGNGKVEADTLDALEVHYAKNPPAEPPMPTTPPPFVIIPASKGTGEDFTIKLGSTLQAKASADVTCKVGSLIPGERVTVYRKPSEVADGFTWHYFERTSTPVGESPNGWASHALPSLPPPIIVDPIPTQAELDMARLIAIDDEIAVYRESVSNLYAQIMELEVEADRLKAKYRPALKIA